MIVAMVSVCLCVTAGLHAQEENADSGAHATATPKAGVAAPDTSTGTAPSSEASKATAENARTTTTDKPAAADDDAARVMHDLVSQMKKNPLIEPTDAPASKQTDSAVNPDKTPGYQPVRVGVDPNIVGTAPGVKGKAPKLRREGEFVISRQGRLVRSDDGLHTLFVFDADAEKSPETPMALVPCQMLQSMEDLVGQRGEQIRFIVSGQILVYRGVNYLLPTMMTLAQDRGNLQ
jgi:hypothetical protein